jgi:hypothetical protein
MISKTSYFQFNLQIFRHFNKNNTHRIVVTGSPKGYENLATGYCKSPSQNYYFLWFQGISRCNMCNLDLDSDKNHDLPYTRQLSKALTK